MGAKGGTQEYFASLLLSNEVFDIGNRFEGIVNLGGANLQFVTSRPLTRAIATESIFDYLTDLELSNFFFGDDLQILGFYEYKDALHIVLSQPWVDGTHPEVPVLKERLEKRGLESESPTGNTGVFILHDEQAGPINVIDVKPDNVVLEEDTGEIIPIDVHFYFDSHEDRFQALKTLGLGPDSRAPSDGALPAASAIHAAGSRRTR